MIGGHMTFKTTVLALLCVVATTGIMSGCSWQGGGTSKTNYQTEGVFEANFVVNKRVSRRPDTYKKHYWKLDIPRQYLAYTRGKSGVVNYDPKREKTYLFHTTLKGYFDKPAGNFKPYDNPNESSVGGEWVRENRAYIRLENKSGYSLAPTEGQCLTSYQQQKLRRPDYSSELLKCDAPNKMCQHYMHIDGWKVVIGMDQYLRQDPQPYCKAAVEFLDSVTISRDIISKK